MKTLTLSQVSAQLAELQRRYGDVPMVLWDQDSSWYFSISAENFEAQQMEDGSVRISVGPNSYGDPTEPAPTKRPL